MISANFLRSKAFLFKELLLWNISTLLKMICLLEIPMSEKPIVKIFAVSLKCSTYGIYLIFNQRLRLFNFLWKVLLFVLSCKFYYVISKLETDPLHLFTIYFDE